MQTHPIPRLPFCAKKKRPIKGRQAPASAYFNLAPVAKAGSEIHARFRRACRLELGTTNGFQSMIILGTYLGIVSILVSAVVCWRCVVWRRRFPDAIFTFCAMVTVFAFLWCGMATYAETALMGEASLQDTLDVWKASGSEPAERTLEEFRIFMAARNNSIMISTVIFTFLLTAFAGLLAFATARGIIRREKQYLLALRRAQQLHRADGGNAES
jgi:hypothetical protein